MNINDQERDTLRSYMENDMSVSRTMRAMFLSQGSVDYRLNQIKAKTGLDPRRFYCLVELMRLLRAEEGRFSDQDMGLLAAQIKVRELEKEVENLKKKG